MTSSNDSSSVERLRAACDRMVEAERTRNLPAVMDLIWPDAVWLAPNLPPVIGGDAIRELFAEFFELPFTDLTVGEMNIRASNLGDLATVWGTFGLTLESPDGEATETMNFLMSWEQRDGAWKATANMFCSNTPLPEG
jgi:uncharacterized protein (TIGR02246 family)